MVGIYRIPVNVHRIH